jgi:hypothetical protein
LCCREQWHSAMVMMMIVLRVHSGAGARVP